MGGGGGGGGENVDPPKHCNKAVDNVRYLAAPWVARVLLLRHTFMRQLMSMRFDAIRQAKHRADSGLRDKNQHRVVEICYTALNARLPLARTPIFLLFSESGLCVP